MTTGQQGREIGRPSVADDHERRHYRLAVDRSEGTMHLQNPRVRGITPFGWNTDLASMRRAGWSDQLNHMCLTCRNVSDGLNESGAY